MEDVKPFEIVDKYGDWYEQQLLGVLLTDPHLMKLYGERICAQKQEKAFSMKGLRKQYKDFSDDHHNILFALSRQLHRATGGETAVPPVLLAGLADNLVATGELLPGEPPAVKAKLEALVAGVDAGFKEAGLAGESVVLHWLERKRGFSLVGDQLRAGMSMDELIFMLDRQKQEIKISRDVFVQPGASLPLEGVAEEAKVVLPTPFRQLNKMLGGGFEKGSATLLAVCSGGGKTALSLQIARNWVTSGYNVVFVTTEEPPSRLEPRLFSNHCDIPYDLLNHGVEPDKLRQGDMEKIREFVQYMRGRLVYIDWSLEVGASIREELDGHLSTLVASGWKPDALILDWIGGGMGKIQESNMHFYRLLMQQAADHMPLLARKYDMVSFATAQTAYDEKTLKKKIIGPQDVAENKSLHRNFQNFIGVSGLRVAGDRDMSETSYQPEQYMSIPKGRHGSGGYFKIRRQLNYQRFIEKT